MTVEWKAPDVLREGAGVADSTRWIVGYSTVPWEEMLVLIQCPTKSSCKKANQ